MNVVLKYQKENRLRKKQIRKQKISLGNMSLKEKNEISHRALAIHKFADNIKKLMYV